MPSLTYTYHYAKCERMFKINNPDKQVLHCPKNYMHIFFSADTLTSHLPFCMDTNNTQTLELFVPTNKPKSKDKV